MLQIHSFWIHHSFHTRCLGLPCCRVGVVVAFRAPIGSVLLALEEVTSWSTHVAWFFYFLFLLPLLWLLWWELQWDGVRVEGVDILAQVAHSNVAWILNQIWEIGPWIRLWVWWPPLIPPPNLFFLINLFIF